MRTLSHLSASMKYLYQVILTTDYPVDNHSLSVAAKSASEASRFAEASMNKNFVGKWRTLSIEEKVGIDVDCK